MLLLWGVLTVQIISRGVVGRAEETSTYSWSRFCTVNCPPASGSSFQILGASKAKLWPKCLTYRPISGMDHMYIYIYIYKI